MSALGNIQEGITLLFLLYFFLSVGLVAPRPPRAYLPGLFFLGQYLSGSSGVAFTFRPCLYRRKRHLKAVWQRLEQSQPHCLILLTSLLLYRFIDVYVYTDCLADNSSQDDPLYVALLRQACGPLSCSLRHMSFLAESVALWRNFHHGVSCCPWCPPVHILPSCPSFSFFVRGILGHPSSPKFQGLLSVVSFSIFPTRHMFS